MNKAEIRTFFESYLETYLINRDFKGTCDYITPETTGFGTGQNEICLSPSYGGPNQSVNLYAKDIKSHPEPIFYDITLIDIHPINEMTFVVMCVIAIELRIGGESTILKNTRISSIIDVSKEAPKVRHMHVSLPILEDDDQQVYPLKELEHRLQVINKKVQDETNTLEQAYAEIANLLNYDGLTGLGSRIYIEQTICSELNRFNRYKTNCSMIFIDVDQFKTINDTFGHGFGDLVLKELGYIIKSNIRETDIAGRWGGDEFLLVLPETSDVYAKTLVESIRIAISQASFGNKCKVTCSLGITMIKENDTLETLFDRVDKALYKSKALGRNQSVLV